MSTHNWLHNATSSSLNRSQLTAQTRHRCRSDVQDIAETEATEDVVEPAETEATEEVVEPVTDLLHRQQPPAQTCSSPHRGE